MTEPPKRSSLKDLDARLKAARKRQEEASGAAREKRAGSTGMGVGFRLAIELVTALVVGVAIGYGLDRWLGTAPLFLIVFFFLGSAAGFLNVYRASSGQGYAVGYRKADEDAANDAGNDADRESDGKQDEGTGKQA